ncbi:MAG: alkane 1-monooxygenase [Bacteroidota bacterium]
MKISYLKYLSAYSLPIVVMLSIYWGGWWSYTAVIYLFVIIPFFEIFMDGSQENMDAVEEELAKEDRVYDFLLYGLVPFQLVILGYFLYRVGDGSLLLYEKIGMITAYGMAAGQAINNAHELGHRRNKFEQFLSKLLLLTSLYMHFFIEHNRGHHKHVATDDDPASSRYGENIYAFYLRTVSGSWMSAWQLEAKRIKKTDAQFWSWENEMLRFQVIQLGLLLLIGLTFGVSVLLSFMVGAIIGFLLLETVNYIEHYGLRRKKKARGYERTLPVHSWNSNHPLGRLILLELSRHSDHHFMANRKYQILRHFDESPQMPTGYPGMMLMAMIPPIWFRVMHKKIDEYKQSVYGENLA